MSINNIKSDLIQIFDFEPSWIEHLKYNPLQDIVRNGKPYHIISLMRYVFGSKNNNPVMSNLRYFYYKEPQVKNIFEEIKAKTYSLNDTRKWQSDDFIGILILLAKIDYFQAYSKKHMDKLVKEIIGNDLFSKTSNLKHRALLIYLIIKLGYNNVFLDRALKDIQSFQNLDGGWPLDLSDSSGDSDIFSTLIIYRSFISNRLWSNKDFLINTEEYLTMNHLSENQSSEDLDKWNRLYSGYKKNNLFEGGSAIFLECLLLNRGKDSDKAKSIVDWLKSIQLKTGYFPYHASLKNQENIPCTIRVLSLIKKYYIL